MAYEQFRGEIIVDFLVPPRSKYYGSTVQYTGPWEPDCMSPYLVEREHPRSPAIPDRA